MILQILVSIINIILGVILLNFGSNGDGPAFYVVGALCWACGVLELALALALKEPPRDK